MTDTTFKSSFPRKNVTPYHDTGRESIFGHCRQPSDLGGTNTHFHPSVCRRQACMDDSSENKPQLTVFAGAGFKPVPQYQRHPHTVIPAKERHPVPRYGAGIHPPAISHLRTDSPIPFSSSVVSVATDMGDCYKNMPSQPVVGATLVASAPTNSTKWGVSYLIYPCSTTVTASKDTNARINPPFASAIVFDRLESGRKWRDSPRPSDALPKLKWQLVGANALVVARPRCKRPSPI